MATARLRWEPKPAFGKLLRRVKNRQKLNRQLCTLMIAMVNETHRHAGIPKWPVSGRARKEGGRTGYKTGRLQRGWRPETGKARIVNRVAYAVDFYYGHGHRTVQVPASYRRLRRGAGSRRRTAGTTMVKAHKKRERPQVARPIRWTRRYIKRAEKTVLKHVLH